MKIIDRDDSWYLQTRNIQISVGEELDEHKEEVILKIEIYVMNDLHLYEKSLAGIRYIGDPYRKKIKKALTIINNYLGHAFRETNFIDIDELKEELKQTKKGAFEEDEYP